MERDGRQGVGSRSSDRLKRSGGALGSSVATAATIGTVAIGEIGRFRYNERLFLGTLAAGGTLGILIPPSINLIIYGALTDTSIPQLYLAGLLPGLCLSVIFMATILLTCMVWREFGGRRVETSWRVRLATAPDLFPPLLIFVVVIGSIYAGIATPTESAALGVVGALIIAAARPATLHPHAARGDRGDHAHHRNGDGDPDR